MKITYIGALDAVRVPLPTGGEIECTRGEPVDMPDSHALVLLDQPDNWQRHEVPAAKPKAEAKSATAETKDGE